MELTAHVHHEDGKYWAEVQELPGCFAAGETFDELREALQEAISLYMTDLPEGATITGFDPSENGAHEELKLALA